MLPELSPQVKPLYFGQGLLALKTFLKCVPFLNCGFLMQDVTPINAPFIYAYIYQKN